MALKILIVEDQFIEAKNLEMMLAKAGFLVCGIAKSVPQAIQIIEMEEPDLALVDIQLKGLLSGIDLAAILKEKNIAFIYVSANSDHETLLKAKATQPYGFIVKPFRERDLTVTLEIAQYRHEHSLENAFRKEELLRKSLLDMVKTEGSRSEKMLEVSKTIQAYLPFDYFAICSNLTSAKQDLMSYLRIGFDEYQFIGFDELNIISRINPKEINRLQSAENQIKKILLH